MRIESTRHVYICVCVCVFQLDVVVADLDGGSVRLPENVHISLMPEPLMSRMIHSLRLVSLLSLPLTCLTYSLLYFVSLCIAEIVPILGDIQLVIFRLLLTVKVVWFLLWWWWSSQLICVTVCGHIVDYASWTDVVWLSVSTSSAENLLVRDARKLHSARKYAKCLVCSYVLRCIMKDGVLCSEQEFRLASRVWVSMICDENNK